MLKVLVTWRLRVMWAGGWDNMLVKLHKVVKARIMTGMVHTLVQVLVLWVLQVLSICPSKNNVYR